MKQAALIAIVGPTAVGKTALSLALAKEFNAQIISADSRQFYRFMDIGTAKPTKDELSQAPHHFIDILNPDQEFSAGRFEQAAEDLMADLFPHSPVLIMVGGSTLYMDAIWHGFSDMPHIDPRIRERLNALHQQEGLDTLLTTLAEVDPATYERIDRRNPARVIRALEVYEGTGKPISYYRKGRNSKQHPYKIIKIGLQDDREQLYGRINERVLQMMDAGLLEEVQQLHSKGYSPKLNSLQTIGYQELFPVIIEGADLDEAIALIQRNSRRYAKRQLTYYRRFEDIQWFRAGKLEEVVSWVQEKLAES